MLTLFFGPCRNVPSWYWVGKDIAEYLRQSCNIRYFETIDQIDTGAVVFWIKNPPDVLDVKLIRMRQLRVIFFPVDYYQDEAGLVCDREFIDACALIACHTSSMATFFSEKPVELVDHYHKYGVAAKARQPNGRFLWIGGYQYFPYIYRYLQEAGLTIPLDILADYTHAPAVSAANRLARHLNLEMDFCSISNFPDLQIIPWSESRQEELLLSCEGAFDYKHVEDFNQRFKPPTKIQKYVASGIPAAVNRGSFSFDYMRGLGLHMCEPHEHERWRSARYKRETADVGASLASKLNIKTISLRYQALAALVAA